jgi:ferredoxin
MARRERAATACDRRAGRVQGKVTRSACWRVRGFRGLNLLCALDDQCIGCQYCVFTCPYEVPQYSEKMGIVRKCDMCTDRLSAGEAPACVQACPNQAISIRVVDKADAVAAATKGEFLLCAPWSGTRSGSCSAVSRWPDS